jgi:hypothetical protein
MSNVLTTLLVMMPALTAAGAIPLTTCGASVVGRAVLTGDLDCSTHPGHALVLDGKLELNGFTLTGNATDPAGYSAVDCLGKCRITVTGPGTIVGGSTAVSGGKVRLKHEITVRDAAEWGISGAEVRLSRCHVLDNGLALAVGPDGGGGIRGGKITVTQATIEDNASFGLDASIRAKLMRSSSIGNGLVDVRSFEKPTLVDAACVTSRRGNLKETWGVCFGD